jgi:hypothetical protein
MAHRSQRRWPGRTVTVAAVLAVVTLLTSLSAGELTSANPGTGGVLGLQRRHPGATGRRPLEPSGLTHHEGCSWAVRLAVMATDGRGAGVCAPCPGIPDRSAFLARRGEGFAGGSPCDDAAGQADGPVAVRSEQPDGVVGERAEGSPAVGDDFDVGG